MTAPLNKAIDCCDSEVDGEIAGLAFSYEDVLVAVPATTLLRTCHETFISAVLSRPCCSFRYFLDFYVLTTERFESVEYRFR